MEFLLILVGIAVIFYLFGRQKGTAGSSSPSQTNMSGIPEERWRQARASGQGSPSRQTASKTPAARWVSPGDNVAIAGVEISGGNFYLGRSLSAKTLDEPENCLVNPSLKVGPGTDPEGETMPYWPSYSEIHPNARRSYLEWLASDRDDPDASIGYVFLYFYGLERRFFVDEASGDDDAIIDEVRRLLSVYGGNGSFRNYATQFLEFSLPLSGDLRKRPEIDAEASHGFEFPLPARLYLGARLADGRVLDADDCLLWFVSMPETRLRTPARRCFDLFRTLWKIRFREHHGEGLKVRMPKRTLKNIGYRAASDTFTASLTGAETIPDITSLTSPLKGFNAIAETCTSELESYSRFVGKRPQLAEGTEAAVLLPKAFLYCDDDNPLKTLSRKISETFAGRQTGKMPLAELCAKIGLEAPGEGKVPASLFNKLGAALDHLDIGYEPDRRYGAVPPPPDGTVVFFHAPNAAAVDQDRAQFHAARTIVEINALAAWADGVVEASELTAVQQEIGAVPGLGPVERVRLLAYASALLSGIANSRALMKGLAKLDDAGRHRVAQAAVAVVLADGHVSHSEVVFIEKLWKTLGLPKEELYGALHSGNVVMDEPVTVMAETSQPSHPIPPPPTAAASAQVDIDSDRLARIVSETNAVSSLLSGIFIEEEAPASPHRQQANSHRVPFDGLDTEHGDLLLFLLAEQRVERSIFEGRAKALRVLPDGAIETINEWGFEIYDEPILEDEEDLTVAEHLRPLLQQMCRETEEMRS
ncbi:TerB N-terminal domain-containing protein [Breoghania sp.]|uniref:tellurite resistance TerB family protein n=1 Tax=Breoghania sp. TaxID=2065378 RepID=UPI002AA83E6C|nr:TerB N-terminal domain-containing protein [Breoghania sp.]